MIDAQGQKNALASLLPPFELERRFRLSLARAHSHFAPKFLIVGDSLAACCPFRPLSRRPFGLLSLARGGAVLSDIAEQLRCCRGVEASWIVIDGGLNDLMREAASPERIERDFHALLDEIPPRAHALFTLMPFVSDASFGAAIDESNRRIARACARAGVVAIDLNPELSEGKTRRPEMTDDGLHFSLRANAIWVDAIRRATTSLD